MNITSRIGTFVLFLALSIVTLGIYPLYWAVVRVEQAVDLLSKIEANTRNSKG